MVHGSMMTSQNFRSLRGSLWCEQPGLSPVILQKKAIEDLLSAAAKLLKRCGVSNESSSLDEPMGFSSELDP